MATKSEEASILLDADVIRHFIKGRQLLKLALIYPKRLIILDIVKDELFRSRHLQTVVGNFISMFPIEQSHFPVDQSAIVKEYAELQKQGFGDGESACMAVAKYNKHIIASSNLKDIKQYCEDNGITYLTTMDILVEAKNKNIMSEVECDQFILEVKGKGSKLPTNTLQEYITNYCG